MLRCEHPRKSCSYQWGNDSWCEGESWNVRAWNNAASSNQSLVPATTPSDPMTNSISAEAEAWEQEVVRVGTEKDVFWASEGPSRYNNAFLTPFEVHQLLNNGWEDTVSKTHIKKVAHQFSCLRGPTKACKQLLQDIAQKKGYTKGQLAGIRTPEFSLCKHMLLAAVRKNTEDRMEMFGFSTGVPAKTDSNEVAICHCFPATSAMPEGCIHGPSSLALWRVDPQQHLQTTLCPTCSTCLRCKKFLGIDMFSPFTSQIMFLTVAEVG